MNLTWISDTDKHQTLYEDEAGVRYRYTYVVIREGDDRVVGALWHVREPSFRGTVWWEELGEDASECLIKMVTKGAG